MAIVDIMIWAYAFCSSVAFMVIDSRSKSSAWAVADHLVADLGIRTVIARLIHHLIYCRLNMFRSQMFRVHFVTDLSDS